jgi:hypothetical protein
MRDHWIVVFGLLFSLAAAVRAEPATYRLASFSALRATPDGVVATVWDGGTLFTSAASAGNWLKVTGHFPDNRWTPLTDALWVRREYAEPVKPQLPPPRRRPADIDRYIVIDKSDFSLVVMEISDGGDRPIFDTRVALGVDRCLPAEKGGRCYYTDPGVYQVRWKVHDPDGIEWCIPAFMEREYAEDIARGQRCFRGSIGNHALNIGKSYAIHGTARPDKLGQRASHGCVRAANDAMATLYDLMEVGDRVYIIKDKQQLARYF